MLLQISTTYQPATDLGYLLHKHPDRFQEVDLSYGKAHIFYPAAAEKEANICLLLDIDPIQLVRNSRNLVGHTLGQYVNDRPYVTSSFMSVAISKAFSTAMNGRCKQRPELVEQKMPLRAKITVITAPKGGELLIRKLFEPIGYTVELQRHELDPEFPDWGESSYYTLELKQETTVQKLLSHLYVLLPVLDNDKHYYISHSEIDKLLDKGGDWLKTHPEQKQIVNRYLRFKSLSNQALTRLLEEEEEVAEETPEVVKERRESLHKQRLNVVYEKLLELGVERVLDLGCGEGKLLKRLLRNKQFKEIVGIDIAYSELLKAKDRLHWDTMPDRQKQRIQLFQSTLTYRDPRLDGYDGAALVEVIEHLDEDRLEALELSLFAYSKPKHVIITTPNREYNVVYKNMTGELRHDDHRFEWTRAEFEAWANKIAEQHAYSVEFYAIGEVKEGLGGPSQMGVFSYED